MRNGLLKWTGALLLGLVALGVGADGYSFAQEAPSPTAREQMDQMMDQMHGEVASQRMRDAMGPDADTLMDQCAAMMGNIGMQRTMRSMMGN